MAKLFFGNLAFETTEDSLHSFISRVAEPTSVEVAMRPDGRSRGFGFAEVDDAVADQVIAELHDAELDGRKALVRRDIPREERAPREGGGGAVDGAKLFVGGIPWSATADELRDVFSQIGEVTDAFIPTERETGRSRGFGFVTMATPELAQKAVAELDGADLGGRPMRINVAQPKGSGGGAPRGGGFRGGNGGGFDREW